MLPDIENRKYGKYSKKYPMTDNFPYRKKTKITQHKLKPGDRSTNPIAERIEVKIMENRESLTCLISIFKT